MKLKDYIELNKIDKDDKNYNEKVLEHLGFDYKDMTVLQVMSKVKEVTDIKPTTITKNKIKINGKNFIIDDILKSTYNQWVMLEEYLKDEKFFVDNLHKVLSIYVRPAKWSWKKFKFIPEPWDPYRKEEIENMMLEMDIEDAFGINLFFYQREKKYIKNMKMLYLNKKMKKTNQMLKSEK